MKPFPIILTLAAATLAPCAGRAKTASEAAPVVIRSGDIAPTPTPWSDPIGSLLFTQAQWSLRGRNYCFYEFGWHGPGYYWCGYHQRRGHGWGGPVGWHGWGRTYRDPAPRGWHGYHGRHNGWHGDEHHGGGHRH